MRSTDPLEKQAQRINHWLRHHTDYQCSIDFYTVYGCIGVQISRNNEPIKAYIGATLEKRLSEIIAYLKIEEWEKGRR